MKLLNLPHKTAPYRCPVNGLCDVYEWKTGQRPTEALIFDSRIGFKLLEDPNATPPVTVFFGEGGVGESEYTFWQDKLGYRMHTATGKPFEDALAEAKGLIDREIPVILFGLDMYHLPFHPNFYHRIHIPYHVDLMVGYDGDTLLAHDNDREGVQRLPAGDLRQAWADGGNTLFGIEMQPARPPLGAAIQQGMAQTANAFLHPPADFLGLSGYRRLVQELPRWPQRFDAPALKAILEHMVTFTGTAIPELPQGLLPYPTGVPNPHRGCRDSLAAVLREHAATLGTKKWPEAASHFEESGLCIQLLTDQLTACIQAGEYALLADAAKTVETLMQHDEQAFACLAE